MMKKRRKAQKKLVFNVPRSAIVNTHVTIASGEDDQNNVCTYHIAQEAQHRSVLSAT